VLGSSFSSDRMGGVGKEVGTGTGSGGSNMASRNANSAVSLGKSSWTDEYWSKLTPLHSFSTQSIGIGALRERSAM